MQHSGRRGADRRRRLLLWLIAPATISALLLVYAIAALLTINSPAVGGGTVVTAACDSDGLTATQTVSYSDAAGGYVVDAVTLAGLANACRNGDFRVALVGIAGLLAESSLYDVPVGSFGGTSNNNTLSLSFASASPAVRADDVTSIHVAIAD